MTAIRLLLRRNSGHADGDLFHSADPRDAVRSQRDHGKKRIHVAGAIDRFGGLVRRRSGAYSFFRTERLTVFFGGLAASRILTLKSTGRRNRRSHWPQRRGQDNRIQRHNRSREASAGKIIFLGQGYHGLASAQSCPHRHCPHLSKHPAVRRPDGDRKCHGCRSFFGAVLDFGGGFRLGALFGADERRIRAKAEFLLDLMGLH